MKEKKKMKPIWWLIIGIILLIVPTAVYLGFLIPCMKEEYTILMASGGAIGSAGIGVSEFIPETAKYGTLYKTATKSFSMLVLITLVQDFIGQLIGLAAVVIVSYIVFKIFKELWKDGRAKQQSEYIAEKVTRSIVETTK